jgi:hypothetical protein
MTDIDKKYKDDSFLFPSRNIDPQLKLQPGYGLKMCESIYSTYIRDKCGFPFSFISIYDEIRRYSNGKQSEHKYMDQLMGKEEPGKPHDVVTDFDGSWTNIKTRRKGYGNILWDIVGLAVRVKTAIFGVFEETDYEVIADTIDPHSTSDQEKKKSELFAEAQNMQFLNEIKQKAGIPTENPTMYPRDLDELELMEQIGEFKTGISKAIEKVCKHTYEISDWYEIKRRLIEDIIDFNSCGVRDYYDETECKWKSKYIDITRVIAQYSDERDFSDSSYFGYIDVVTISSIRRKLEERGYKEEDIKHIAMNWSGINGNPIIDDWNKYNKQDVYGEWVYDFYKCALLDVEWIDSDLEYKTENVSKRGIRTLYDQEFGKQRNSANNKTRTTTIRRKYEAKWIVGTQMIFDHRLSVAQTRNRYNKTPLMSFHLYKGSEESIIRRLIPIYDNFQLAWLKLQQYLADEFDGVTLLDQTVFDRVKIKGKAYDILDLIGLMKKTRMLPYRSLPMNGKYPGGNVSPIQRIPSELINSINNCITLFQNSLNMVEMITGINPVAIGSQPSSGDGKATTEMALQGTTKVLKPMIDSIFKVKKNSAEFIAEGVRLKVQTDNECYKMYARIIGQNDVQALKENDYDLTELGISLMPRPTTQDIQNIMRAAEIAMEDGRNGKPGITLDVYLYITEKVISGANLKDIRLYLSNAIRKKTEQEQAQKERDIQIQNEGLQKIEQQKQKAEMDKERQRHQNNMDEASWKHSSEMQQMEAKYNGDHGIIDHQSQAQQQQPQQNPQINQNA